VKLQIVLYNITGQNCGSFRFPPWIFTIFTPIISVTWSFRNHSDMMICISRNIYYNVE